MNDHSANRFRKRRVLVIDDEPGMRETLDTVLSWEGYEVDTAECGEAAIEQAKSGDFDLAITDLRMPGMGGDEAITTLKRIRPQLAIIVVTGYASDEAAVRCTQGGALGIIRKPVEIAALLELVETAIGKPEVQAP